MHWNFQSTLHVNPHAHAYSYAHVNTNADSYGNTKAGFSATTEIKRSDFGVDFNIPGGLEGMVISDTHRWRW